MRRRGNSESGVLGCKKFNKAFTQEALGHCTLEGAVAVAWSESTEMRR